MTQRLTSRACPECAEPLPAVTGTGDYCPACGARLGRPKGDDGSALRTAGAVLLVLLTLPLGLLGAGCLIASAGASIVGHNAEGYLLMAGLVLAAAAFCLVVGCLLLPRRKPAGRGPAARR